MPNVYYVQNVTKHCHKNIRVSESLAGTVSVTENTSLFFLFGLKRDVPDPVNS